jgi:hypothetical protein
MGSPSRKRRITMLAILVGPIRDKFKKDQVLTTSTQGCRTFHIANAVRGADEVVRDVMVALLSPDTVRRLEFASRDQTSEGEQAVLTS